MANLQNRLSFTSRIITRGWIFVFFVAAVLSTSISFAEIVGTEDFDGNKSGWNWDGGTAQGWTNRDGNPIDITTETDDSGNHRAKIVSSQVFLSYGTSDNLNSGTFAYAFDMQLPSQKIWGGFSLFSNNNSSEKLFLGVNGENVLRLINYGSSTDFTSTTNDYLGTNNTFAVVANSTGIFAWAFPLGHKLQYEDLYTTPTLQLATTLGANSSFRLGTGETIYVDNIKMAYSDSNTVVNKGDATSVTSLTEVFDAVPIVECIKEAFSNYEDGPIAG